MEPEGKSLVSTRVMEIVVGVLVIGFGALVIYDSNRLGSGWGADGPESGYFPFYIGLILCLSSAAAIVQAFRKRGTPDPFVERDQAVLVLKVLIPSLVFVVAVKFLGMYLASAIFIAAFMAWQGKFGIFKCVSVAAMVAVSLFLMFEIWFKVPLPKGPLESMIGFG